MQPNHSTQIDKHFKILYADIEKNEICMECLNDRDQISLWRLFFSSKKTTEKWLEKLRKAVRPEWDDPNANSCSICGKAFMLFRRQHHCRNCGKVICSSHSKMVNNLVDLGYSSKVRVCVGCVNRIGTIDGVERARSLGEREKGRKSTLLYGALGCVSANGSLLAFNK